MCISGAIALVLRKWLKASSEKKSLDFPNCHLIKASKLVLILTYFPIVWLLLVWMDFQLIFWQVTWTINRISADRNFWGQGQQVFSTLVQQNIRCGWGHQPAGRKKPPKPNFNRRAHINGISCIPTTSNSGDEGECTTESHSATTESHPTKTGSQNRSI